MTANSETRFAHLLEPIRDIAQNWSIDIALELEDYLAGLVDPDLGVRWRQAGRFPRGASAAHPGFGVRLLEKVEHLYTLVLNTLNQVVEKKNAEKNKGPRSGRPGAGDEEDEEDEDAFGCLEDTLKEVENVSQPVVGTAATSARSPSPPRRSRLCRSRAPQTATTRPRAR